LQLGRALAAWQDQRVAIGEVAGGADLNGFDAHGCKHVGVSVEIALYR
jgi:hypothetical protein